MRGKPGFGQGAWSIALLFAILAALAQPVRGNDPPPGSSAPVEVAPSLDTLVIRMAEAGRLPREAQRLEYERLDRSFQRWGTVASRVELAWLLSRPGSGFQDNRRAAQLLSEYIAQPDADPALRSFAEMLYDLILERAVQRAASSRAQRELVEQRRQAEGLSEQIETLLQVLATLQGQVDALRDIERNINQRATPDDTETWLPDDSGESNTPGG